MTRKFKKVSVAFVLSAAVCTVVGFSANAESLNCVTSNAGITAALEQSYYTEKASLNIATAEVLIHGLERGDLDWRNIVK